MGAHYVAVPENTWAVRKFNLKLWSALHTAQIAWQATLKVGRTVNLAGLRACADTSGWVAGWDDDTRSRRLRWVSVPGRDLRWTPNMGQPEPLLKAPRGEFTRLAFTVRSSSNSQKPRTALPVYRAGVAPAAYREMGRQHRRRFPGFAGGKTCRDGAVDALTRRGISFAASSRRRDSAPGPRGRLGSRLRTHAARRTDRSPASPSISPCRRLHDVITEPTVSRGTEVLRRKDTRARRWDRQFESCFLQRGVRCEPDFLESIRSEGLKRSRLAQACLRLQQLSPFPLL